MSNTRSNIDYVQLCKALEEGNKKTAQSLIRNNANGNTFNENDRYNWANIIYEALEIFTISKVLQENDRVINQNSLLNDRFYPTAVNTSKRQGIVDALFHSLNMFRRAIRTPVHDENRLTTQRSVLIHLNNGNPRLICHPQSWVDCIFTILNKFSEVFYSKTQKDKLAELMSNWILNTVDLNSNEFQKWTTIISETLDITIRRFDSGVNIHAKNHNYYKLLNVAIQKNNTLEACLFIKKGIQLGDLQILENLIMLLLGAIEQKNDTIAKVLIDHGMQYNPLINLIIPLNVAISQGQSKIIEYILPHFQFLKLSDQQLYKQAVVRLEKEAQTHVQIPGNRYIFDMIKNGYYKVAQSLLNYNSDIQYISSRGDTPLHKAIENDFDVEFIKSLLKLNPPINTANHKMLTPLLVACKTQSVNQFEIVEILLQHNANVNCADHSLKTPLHFACQIQNLEVVRILLKHGANPNAKNNEDETPLHLVYGSGDYFSLREKKNKILSIIKLLLQHNTDLEAVDSKGWTPLFAACKAGHEPAVKYLLENNANFNHTDLENQNSLHIAVKYCFYFSIKVVEILLKYKTNVHCINTSGKSIIHCIVERDIHKLIKCFAHTKINFNSVDKEGNTPLHNAIIKGSVGMTKILLKYGANINIFNKRKRTPLQEAIKCVSYHKKKLNDHNFIRQWYKSNFDSDEERTIELLQDFYTSIHVSSYKKITRILKIHVIKLKIAGLKINKQNWNVFYNSENFTISGDESSDEDYISDTEDSTTDFLLLEMDCEQEIEKMKMENIGTNNMTLYDLLTKNVHLLSRYVRNKEIRKTVESEAYNKKFPLYVNIIRSRFRDAKLRYRLMNPAKKYFSLNICKRLPDYCVDTIFSYLKIKDINMFIRAIKLLD